MNKAGGNTLSEHNWLTAYQISFKNGIDVYDESPGEFEKTIILPSKSNPEKEFMKKELADNLSEEAKEIVRIILNGPSEIVSTFFSDTYNCVSKARILIFFRKKGWKRKVIRTAFNELKEFTKNIDEIG
jgi:hypothetical protein